MSDLLTALDSRLRGNDEGFWNDGVSSAPTGETVQAVLIVSERLLGE